MVNCRMLQSKMASVGMTQTALSAAVGMSRSNMNAKMNNHYPFNTDEVVKICDVLGIVAPAEKVAIFLPETSQL